MVSATFILPCLLVGSYAQGLHTLAKAAGLEYFGTATDNPELTDAPYVAMLENSTQWGAITPGNSMKWDAVEPTQDAFVYTKGDVIASLAANNSMYLRCHTTVWYSQLPSWVSGGTWTNATLIAVMQNHITNEMAHYKGQCYHWDVVNEAFSDSNGAWRDSIFYTTIGEAYIQIAFEAARAADSTAKLYYNDYNIEYSGAKATSALAMITNLVNNGAPIDGVGFQGHYIVGSMPSSSDLIKTMGSYTALGLEVAITELDIRISSLPSTAATLAQQSTDYQTAVNSCLGVAKCIGITVWDFTDKYSWIPATFSGQGDACLFDEDLVAKPAYAGVESALKASTRTATVISSSAATILTSSTVAASSSTVVASSSSPVVLSTAAAQTISISSSILPTTLQTIVKSASVSAAVSHSATPVETSASPSTTSSAPFTTATAAGENNEDTCE